MSSQRRQERYAEEIGHLAARFLELESDGRTLITVTSTTASPDLKYITIYCSVFPDTSRKLAMEFVNRKSREFLDYLAKNANLGRLPKIKFVSDGGEMNRQHLETIFRKIQDESK